MSALRVAVALSGGVDSAVAALLLSRCAPSLRDVEALCRAPCPLSFRELCAAVERGRPFTEWLSPAFPSVGTADNRPVSYAPVFMRNWADGDGDGGALCESAARDCADATDAARRIGLLRDDEALPLRDFRACYVDACFNPMLDAFARGDTLNVDILCNAEVKFRALLSALRGAGFDALATGHYARAVRRGGRAVVARPFTAGNDLNDQTHFLSRLAAPQIARALFPLGHAFARKADVRALAARCGLAAVAAKKTSTGLCFVGERPRGGFRAFLDAFVPPDNDALRRINNSHNNNNNNDKDGGGAARTAFVDAESGAAIAASELLPAYALTVGQSVRPRGPNGPRMFVLAKEPFAAEGDASCARYLRTVRLVPRWDHPLLYRREIELRDVLLADEVQKTRGGAEERKGRHSLRFRCAARHQDEPRPATLSFNEEDVGEDGRLVTRAEVVFDEPVRAPVTGQAVVAYAELEAGGPPTADWFVAASGWIV